MFAVGCLPSSLSGAVAVVFSIGLLLGRHFLFPRLLPLLLELFLVVESPAQRLSRPALFLLFVSRPPLVLAAIYYYNSRGKVAEPWAFVICLFRVGKGVGTR